MVLPASAPDDSAAARLNPAWLKRLVSLLELGHEGTIVLLAQASPVQLAQVVRSLPAKLGELRLCLTASELGEVAEGELAVAWIRGGDLSWLNAKRPLFAKRRLRVVLLADGPTSSELGAKASDLSDWISHTLICPATPFPFAVAGLQAVRSAPGVVWVGADLEPTLGAVAGETPVVTVSLDQPYARLVDALTAAEECWIICEDLEASSPQLLRLALAEARRLGRVIARGEAACVPGWPTIDALTVSPALAADRLRQAGLPDPERAAALLVCEEGALELVEQLAQSGVPAAELAEAIEEGDSSALGWLAFDHLFGAIEAAALWRAAAPILRTAGIDPRVGTRRAELLAEVASAGDNPARTADPWFLALWAAEGTSAAARPESLDSVWQLERALWAGTERAEWSDFARSADELELASAAEAWASRAAAQRLFIDEEHFIRVDPEGYCLGPFREGDYALVLQTESIHEDQAPLALRIPRLGADLPLEDLLRVEAFQGEIDAARAVAASNSVELFPVQWHFPAFGRPLLSKYSSAPEARVQHGQLLLVQFQRDRPPRLIGLRKGGEKASPALFDRIQQATDPTSGSAWQQVVVLDDTLPEEGNVAPLAQLLPRHGRETTWYACLPDLRCRWATHTLQEAAATGRLASWTLQDSLRLTERLLRSIAALHRRGLVHGNISLRRLLCFGETKPEHCRLSGYGRASVLVPQQEPNRPFGGAVAGRHTTTSLPERRGTIEREFADTALIVASPEREDLRVLLGWKVELLPPVGKAHRALLDWVDQIVDSDWPRAEGAGMLPRGSLLPGDLIQLRDLVFRVNSFRRLPEGLLLACDRRYWRVTLGRWLVATEAPPPARLSFASVIIRHQWSAATDLSDVGAVLLCLLFPSQGNFHALFDWANSLRAIAPIWRELTVLCRALATSPNPAELLYSLADGTRSVSEGVAALTQLVIDAVPGSAQTLAKLGDDGGRLLLVLQFALRCLHRGEDLPASEFAEGAPYCASRVEPPRSDVADKALRDLEELTARLRGGSLPPVKVDDISGHALLLSEASLRARLARVDANMRSAADLLEETLSLNESPLFGIRTSARRSIERVIALLRDSERKQR